MDKNKRNFFQLIVVGAGGTGGYFLKEASRFLSSGINNIVSYQIFDGDTIEERNLSRQCFQREDLGRTKSSVMAEILHQAFEIPWKAHGYLTSQKQLEIEKENIPILIGCVDNHACRKLMEDFFESQNHCIYLDAANEFSSGEVVFSYRFKRTTISPLRSYYFPEIRQQQNRSRLEMSCEELNHFSPQHIATNMMAGNILLSELYAILSGCSHTGMIVFDSIQMHMHHIPYKKKNDNCCSY